MSQENVEIVRQVIDAWNQRDEDLAVSYMDPDVEWAPAGPAAVERTVYRGREECSRGFAAVWETWEEFHFEETEVRDLGDSVLWLGHVQMRGKTSHVELDQEFANHIELLGGRIVRVDAFLTWRDGFEAAGLREQRKARRRDLFARDRGARALCAGCSVLDLLRLAESIHRLVDGQEDCRFE